MFQLTSVNVLATFFNSKRQFLDLAAVAFGEQYDYPLKRET
jgi:hypothetical protein